MLTRNPHIAEPLRSIVNEVSAKVGMFRDHRCWKCNDGEKSCVAGNPRQCEYPHARND